MFVAYVVIMTGLALCCAYADFGLNKPGNWTARDWTYWALTVFSLLVLCNVIINDPRWMSGAAYLIMFVLAPAWTLLTLGRGLSSIAAILGPRRE